MVIKNSEYLQKWFKKWKRDQLVFGEVKLSEFSFQSGSKDGSFKKWFSSGNKKSAGNFVKDKENGKFLEWYDNGKKYIEQDYKGGKKHGLMFSWYDTGSKRSKNIIQWI